VREGARSRGDDADFHAARSLCLEGRKVTGGEAARCFGVRSWAAPNSLDSRPSAKNDREEGLRSADKRAGGVVMMGGVMLSGAVAGEKDRGCFEDYL
jgi:hypothetical protein